MSARTRLAVATVAALGLTAGAAGLAAEAPALRAPATTSSTSSTTTTVAPTTTLASSTSTALLRGVAVSPTTVSPGGTTTVSGTCEADTTGFAMSAAFVHDATHDFAGVGAVPFTTDGNGHFSVTATVATTTASGSYPVSIRCGGGSLGVTATLTVGPAAATPVPAQPTFTG
jgi:hypothetical protein